MNSYRQLLLQRHAKAAQSQPPAPEKPLTWTQYKNKLNVSKWREKLIEFHLTQSWGKAR